MTREQQVAQAMADEPTRNPPRSVSAEEIGAALGMTPSYVRAMQTRIRKRMGWQAA